MQELMYIIRIMNFTRGLYKNTGEV